MTLSLLGEKNGHYLDGVPCATRTLDHSGSTDYDGSNGSSARFDGTLGGNENDAEKERKLLGDQTFTKFVCKRDAKSTLPA